MAQLTPLSPLGAVLLALLALLVNTALVALEPTQANALLATPATVEPGVLVAVLLLRSTAQASVPLALLAAQESTEPAVPEPMLVDVPPAPAATKIFTAPVVVFLPPSSPLGPAPSAAKLGQGLRADAFFLPPLCPCPVTTLRVVVAPTPASRPPARSVAVV